MPDLAQMRDDLGKVTARAKSIIENYAAGGLPPEKKIELDALMKKAGELRTGIEHEKDVEAKKKDLNDLDAFLNAPQRVIPHSDDGDGTSPERKALAKAGWEVKGGLVYAPTSAGKHVEMFGEEVLFGPIPEDDPNAAVFYKTTRAAMRPEYKSAYARLIRVSPRAFAMGAAPMSLLSGPEQKALSEGTDPSGGFLVPPDVQAEMLVRVAQEAIFRGKAKVQTTSRDILKFPAVQANVTSGSIYSSGFVGGWAGETPVFSDTDPQFGSFDIPVKKLRVATRLSNDFVADAAVNVLAFLAQNGAENMALVEDSGFINGDGSPLQPRGILNSTAVTADVSGATAGSINNTNANLGSATKIIDLCYLLPPQYLKTAQWIFRRSAEGHIRKLVDAQNRFIWPPYVDSGFGATPRDLLAYPISNSDFVPADSATGNRCLIFGALDKAYIIAQRAQVTSTVLRERFADTDQVGIILWERVGGDTWNPDAVRIGTS